MNNKKFEFEYCLNKNDFFLSSIYYNYFSIGGIFSILFTLFAIFILIFTIISGNFKNLTFTYKILLIVCCLLFSIIQPILVYIKIFIKFLKNKQQTINIIFNDDNFILKIGQYTGEYKYDKIYKIKKYSTMCILMFDAINGQIIPNRAFNNNKNEFYNFILNKIIILL